MKFIQKKETDLIYLSIFLRDACEDVIKQWHVTGKGKDEVISNLEMVFKEVEESIED